MTGNTENAGVGFLFHSRVFPKLAGDPVVFPNLREQQPLIPGSVRAGQGRTKKWKIATMKKWFLTEEEMRASCSVDLSYIYAK